MERKIVGITGLIGSGKDSFSKEFIDAGYYKISFADTLKDAVSVIFGWDREMLSGSTPESRIQRETVDEYWSSKLKFDVTPRWVLQNLGTDVIRHYFNDNIWVYSAERKILDHDKVIITDCRFMNEIDMIRENKGTIIEVQRNLPDWYDEAVWYNKFCEEQYNSDSSESYYEDFDMYIESCMPRSLTNIHTSEYGWVGLNNPDIIIQNNSTLLDLETKAKDIISKL